MLQNERVCLSRVHERQMIYHAVRGTESSKPPLIASDQLLFLTEVAAQTAVRPLRQAKTRPWANGSSISLGSVAISVKSHTRRNRSPYKWNMEHLNDLAANGD